MFGMVRGSVGGLSLESRDDPPEIYEVEDVLDSIKKNEKRGQTPWTSEEVDYYSDVLLELIDACLVEDQRVRIRIQDLRVEVNEGLSSQDLLHERNRDGVKWAQAVLSPIDFKRFGVGRLPKYKTGYENSKHRTAEGRDTRRVRSQR
jgi:hypothetical protein